MPQHKSAWKRIRTSAKQRERNRQVRARFRSAMRKFQEGEVQDKPELLRVATSELDNAVRKGVLKQRTASRRKSRMARSLNRMGQETA